MNNTNQIATNLNVRDEFKHLTVGEIQNIVSVSTLPFAVLMSQIRGDYNFGSVMRSANAFGAKTIYYYGKKHWDKRFSLGTSNYSDVQFLSTIEEIKSLKYHYSFVGLENNIKYPSVNIKNFVWPQNSLICIGEETMGLQEEILSLCDHLVTIPMVGSIRSFNASVAGSIAMYDFVTKYTKD